MGVNSLKKTALLSVYNKGGIEALARTLIDLGWELYASDGTAKYLKKHGISAQETSELVGGKAILGHRVVTLSREIYAGLLATVSQTDTEELKKLDIPRIDLVCVDFYPLAEEIKNTESTEESVINQTDIGGPTLLRAAAKGRRIVISQVEQREKVISWLKDGEPDSEEFLCELAATAEAEVAAYALDSARYHSDGGYEGSMLQRVATAKYGENPWQQNAWLYENISNTDPLALSNFTLELGTPPSYNNYADIDRLLQTMTHVAAGYDKNRGQVPAIALGGKHGNVCGAAIGQDAATVTKNMLEGDLRAIFGGVMMLNYPIDETVAEILLTHKVDKGRRLIDGIVAPEITPEAIKMLQRKGDKCRILTNPALKELDATSLDAAPRNRYVRGGALVQDNYTEILNLNAPGIKVSNTPDEQTSNDIILGWAIGSTSNSNTITIVRDGMLMGNGVGQQDRVSAGELAVKRATEAGHNVEQAVAYSDSFFPFPDGSEALAAAGITTIFASSGSVGDTKVRGACEKAGVNFITLPDQEIRGFYAH